MKLGIGKLISAIVTTAKANPSLVISAATAIGPIVKAVKKEVKRVQ